MVAWSSEHLVQVNLGLYMHGRPSRIPIPWMGPPPTASLAAVYGTLSLCSHAIVRETFKWVDGLPALLTEWWASRETI